MTLYDILLKHLPKEKQQYLPPDNAGEIHEIDGIRYYNQALKDVKQILQKLEVDEVWLEEIILINEQSCPNKECKEGLIRIYIGTKDEGNILCRSCNGKGVIEFTNKDKAHAIASNMDKIIKEK